MKKAITITLLVGALLLSGLQWQPVQAQDENDENRDPALGTIQGVVYEDVNGNGQCVNTGVPGEGPVEGVDIDFISSDRETVITLYSGPEGIFGLFAAGYSHWEVRARPGPEWIVTSENPIYAPIYEDSLVQTGVNFCVRQVAHVPVVLPASGQANMGWLTAVSLFLGLSLIAAGLVLHQRTNNINNI
jgi:hypothetical protein